MVVCLGCAAIFSKEANLRSHYTQSLDPRCVAIRKSLGRILQGAYVEDDDDDEEPDEEDEEEEAEFDIPMDVDEQHEAPFEGDYYGDEYGPGDFPGFGEEDEDPTVHDGLDAGYESEDNFSGDEEDYV